MSETPINSSDFTTRATLPAPHDRRSAWVAVLALIAAAMIIGLVVSQSPRDHGAWGTTDFVEYWAANTIVANGDNPYDAARMLAVEQASGRDDAVPLMMWNPPWLLVFMRPVLTTSFPESAARWLAINGVLLTLSCVLITAGYQDDRFAARDLIPAAFGALLSAPAVMTLQLGQVSLLLLFGVSLLYWGLSRRRDLVAGAGLAILSVKPHLFLLVVTLVALETWRTGRWRIVAGAAGIFGALVIATALRAPTLFDAWRIGMSTPQSLVPAAITWRTPNLPNVLREIVAAATGASASWPLTVIPALAVLSTATWLWRRPRRESLVSLFPVVLCLSVITAPFGWTFDHVVLALPQIIVCVRAFDDDVSPMMRWLLVMAVVGCHLGIVMQAVLTGADYFAYWWFPLAMLSVWLFADRSRHQFQSRMASAGK